MSDTETKPKKPADEFDPSAPWKYDHSAPTLLEILDEAFKDCPPEAWDDLPENTSEAMDALAGKVGKKE